MSKHRVAVLRVVAGQLSVTAAPVAAGISRQHLQRLLGRYRDGGLEALEPRSRRPLTSPSRTPDEVRARIVTLRTELTVRGVGAGPVTALPKACPAGRGAAGHFRLRYDLVDRGGRITLRRAGRLHHLGVGASNARRRVLAIVDEHEVTVVALATGEVLSTHRIEPEKSYWRNQRRDPGRWPESQATE